MINDLVYGWVCLLLIGRVQVLSMTTHLAGPHFCFAREQRHLKLVILPLTLLVLMLRDQLICEVHRVYLLSRQLQRARLGNCPCLRVLGGLGVYFIPDDKRVIQFQ